MNQSTSNEELVLHPHPVGLIVGCVFFGICGGASLVGGSPISGSFAIALAALSFMALVWAAFSLRSRLRLTPEGFTFGSMRRVSTYRWSDVTAFFPQDVGGHKRVCFTFSKQFDGEMKLRKINQEFGGFDRFLTENYGMKPDQLAELLESWRIRYADRQLTHVE